MDQVTTATMDTRKPAVRSTQLSSKLPNQDSNRDVSKRSNGGGRRQQREWERDAVGGGNNGGSRGKGNGGPGKSGWGRAANKSYRNKEKEGGQIRYRGGWSLDYDDYEDYPKSGSGRRLFHHNVTHSAPSWYSGARGGRQSSGRPDGGWKKSHPRSSGVAVRNAKARALQARCQFMLNYKLEAETLAAAKRPVGFTPAPTETDGCKTAVGGSVGTADVAALHDPDLLVNWDSVQEVLLHMTQPTNCPVCLYPPVAPQVTKCGHIYCFPCILHYLALSDEKWRACPICYEMVVRQDLKSVVCMVHPDYSVGSSIEMHLMRRHRQSVLPLALHQLTSDTTSQQQQTFSRTIPATVAKVEAIIERERTALEVQMATEGSEPEACFIEQALSIIAERKANMPDFGNVMEDEILAHQLHETTLQDDASALRVSAEEFIPQYAAAKENIPSEFGAHGMGDDREDRKSSQDCNAPPLVLDSGYRLTASTSAMTLGSLKLRDSTEESDDSSSISSSLSNEVLIAGDVSSLTSDGYSDGLFGASGSDHLTSPDCVQAANVSSPPECLQFELEDDVKEDPTKSVVDKKNRNSNKSPYHYFYQACDGSHVYLHPLNVAMLSTEFGGIEKCPLTITATIIEKDYGVVDEAMRQHYKHLSHLPLCCSYELVELDLHPPLVSPETLREFRTSLHRRQQARAVRVKKEQQIEHRNRQQEEKELSGRLFQRVESAFVPHGSASSGESWATSPVVDYDRAYPMMGASDNTGRTRQQSVSSDGIPSPEMATSPTGGSSVPQHENKQHQAPPSFAKMLTVAPQSAPKPAWPSLGRSSGTSAASGTAWPHSSSSSSAAASSKKSEGVGSDDEAQFNAPDYTQTFSRGFDAMLSSALSNSSQTGQGGKKNKKGKKKSKQVLLFSSGVGY